MLRIGSLALPLPAVQAALSGYSDLTMRRVARRHGAPFAFHEVVLDQHVLRKGKLRQRILDVQEDDHPVGGQLMGSDPATFGPAARDMVDAGYDVVDVNFGCPVPNALSRCRGGHLLGTPETALQILDRVVDAVAGRVPVMVKMRRGIDDSPASEKNFFTILEGAYERGVAAVVVHGRTVKQRYLGPSSSQFLTRVKRHVGAHVLLGSGDLFSPFAIQRMLAETGVDGVTVARGAIGNPWIFEQTRQLLTGLLPTAPDVGTQREAILLHQSLAELQYGVGDVSGACSRRAAIRYARHHPEALLVRDAFAAAKGRAGLQQVLEAFYGPAFTDWIPPVMSGDREHDAPIAPEDSSCTVT